MEPHLKPLQFSDGESDEDSLQLFVATGVLLGTAKRAISHARLAQDVILGVCLANTIGHWPIKGDSVALSFDRIYHVRGLLEVPIGHERDLMKIKT